MTAPPQAHAQSFAKAMRTDMMSHSSCCWRLAPHGTVSSFCAINAQETQNKLLSASETSGIYLVLGRFFALPAQSLWLMYGFGTVLGPPRSLLEQRHG
jgi:hypothetical protein